MMHQLIDKKKIIFYIFIFLFLSTINNTKIINYKKQLSKLKEIEVRGLNENLNLSIQKDLEFLLNKNIYKLDYKIIEKILEKNNFIENYNVLKYYPSKIVIDLKQTKFIATTFKNNQKFIIGSNGKLIDHKIINYKKNIPNVFGNFTNKDFIDLIKILKMKNFKFDNIEDFFYYPSGRWDIKTNNNLIVKLPTKDVDKAIDKFNLIINNDKLKEYNIIDLRITNQIILSNEK